MPYHSLWELSKGLNIFYEKGPLSSTTLLKAMLQLDVSQLIWIFSSILFNISSTLLEILYWRVQSQHVVAICLSKCLWFSSCFWSFLDSINTWTTEASFILIPKILLGGIEAEPYVTTEIALAEPYWMPEVDLFQDGPDTTSVDYLSEIILSL
jgi:hypothetical protein